MKLRKTLFFHIRYKVLIYVNYYIFLIQIFKIPFILKQSFPKIRIIFSYFPMKESNFLLLDTCIYYFCFLYSSSLQFFILFYSFLRFLYFPYFVFLDFFPVFLTSSSSIYDKRDIRFLFEKKMFRSYKIFSP